MSPRRALDWSLAGLAFAAPVSIAGMNAALVLLSAALLWAWTDAELGPALRRASVESLSSPVFGLLAASSLWFFISGLAGEDPARSLKLAPKELHKLWAFAALAAALGAARRGPALTASALGLAAHALIGMIAAAAAAWQDGAPLRARGFIHPVSYGNILGLAFVFAACALARPSSPAERRAARSLAALLGTALVLNQTRAVLLASAAAAVAAALAAPALRRRMLGALLALAAVAAFWEVMPTGGRNIRTLLSREEGAGHRSRLVLWDAALAMSRERPLSGVGPGNFRSAFERLHPTPLDSDRSWGSAHNLFLHQLAERGVVGLALVAALFAAFAAASWRAALRGSAAGLAAFAGTAAFLVMNMTETAWQTEQVAAFFLLIWTWGAGPRRAGEVL